MTKSPTVRLLLGLLVTLAAVTIFSSYSLHQLGNLRTLQTQIVDLNRHDSLLLQNVQDDFNNLGLKLQNMTERPALASISEYRSEFERLREHLDSALKSDAAISPASARARKKAELLASLQRFWNTSDQLFRTATAGHEVEARRIAAGNLSDQQIVLAKQLSDLLAQNNELEARADHQIASIYSNSERDIYLFLTGTILTIVITSLYLIYSNRKLFEALQAMSHQRRVLAARLISVQEEVLRSVSRELHDEFGQILTAVSTMLARAERKGLPPDSPFRTELAEVREITHNTLEKMRSLSQILHPAVLDDYGLAKAIEWYTQVFERQAGIATMFSIVGEPVSITGAPATHCFRIVQEALNNVARHSGALSVQVEMIFTRTSLTISVKDSGKGIAREKSADKPGLGLIAMRERAEILSGELQVTSAASNGTTVTLVVPISHDELPDTNSTELVGELK
jgi:signal transduction histidine kinase